MSKSKKVTNLLAKTFSNPWVTKINTLGLWLIPTNMRGCMFYDSALQDSVNQVWKMLYKNTIFFSHKLSPSNEKKDTFGQLPLFQIMGIHDQVDTWNPTRVFHKILTQS